MKKKILVLDSMGMAGHMISNYLKETNKYNVKGLLFDKTGGFNISYAQEILKSINKHEPDIIINTLRFLVEESEQEPYKAIYYNSFFPKYLEKLYLKSKTKIIHLSTDCVFSGSKGSYNENSIKDGLDWYAKTRALGEIVNDKDLTFRTSYIGPVITQKPEELFDWFLSQKGEVRGYKNAFWTGVTTLELAKGIDVAIENNISGLYHFVPDKKISKYELLKMIKNIWNKDNINIVKYENQFIDKSLIDNRKEIVVASYENMFNELFEYMFMNKNSYKKYFQQ